MVIFRCLRKVNARHHFGAVILRRAFGNASVRWRLVQCLADILGGSKTFGAMAILVVCYIAAIFAVLRRGFYYCPAASRAR